MKRIILCLCAILTVAVLSGSFVNQAWAADTPGSKCLQFGPGGMTVQNTCAKMAYLAWCVHNPSIPYVNLHPGTHEPSPGEPSCEAGQIFSTLIDPVGKVSGDGVPSKPKKFQAKGERVGDSIEWAECHNPFPGKDDPHNGFDYRYDAKLGRIVAQCLYVTENGKGGYSTAKGAYVGKITLP